MEWIWGPDNSLSGRASTIIANDTTTITKTRLNFELIIVKNFNCNNDVKAGALNDMWRTASYFYIQLVLGEIIFADISTCSYLWNEAQKIVDLQNVYLIIDHRLLGIPNVL